LDTEITTNSPYVAIIVGAFGFASTAVTVIVGTMIKKWISATNETSKLKERIVIDEISKTSSEIRSDMLLKHEKLSGEFKLLEAKVMAAVKAAEDSALQQGDRLARAMTAMANFHKESKRQFEDFQRKLEETHIWVERMKKARGD
jgi:hypothetical protein